MLLALGGICAVLAGATPTATAATYPTVSGPVVAKAQPDGVFAVHSIPFAEPPVGDLRWRPPQPPQSWTTPRDGTKVAPACAQGAGYPVMTLEGSEDCLYLSVYTTTPPPTAGVNRSSTAAEGKPVLLWVHGGGLVSGDGYLDGYYDGSHLAQAFNVVVVSIQYRLGTFGFMALPENQHDGEGTLGNLGLLDQQAAMKWAKQNVKFFGGDSDRITVFGESAGANSMCAHLVSPLSAGLFARMVVESGDCGQVRPAADVVAFSRSFAASRGCATNGTALRKCLLSKSTSELLYPFGSDLSRSSTLQHGNSWDPVFPWDMTAGDAALPLLPLEALAARRFNKVPVIFGTNADEFQCACAKFSDDKCLFAMHVPVLVPGVTWPDLSDADLHKVVAHFGSQLSDDQFVNVLKAYPTSDFPRGAVSRLSQMMVDSQQWIGSCQTRTAAKLVAAAGGYVYVYLFDHPGAYATTGHFSEVAYVFQACTYVDCQGTGMLNATDHKLMFEMGTRWTSFAASGNPSPTGTISWPRYTTESDKVLKLGLPSSVVSDWRSDKCKLWVATNESQSSSASTV